MSEGEYRALGDEELVKRAQREDEAAFTELVVRYEKRALSVAIGIVGNRDDALDVVQDAFLNAYRSLKKFKFGSQFYTWFYRILVNRAIDRVREFTRSGNVSFDETWMVEDETAVSGDSLYTKRPDEIVERGELRRVIGSAIESLPEHHRVVIILREVEGLQYEEIAQILGVSIGTVMSRLHYAREKLRETLKEYVRGKQ